MQARSSFQDSFIAHNSADSPLLGVGCEDFGSSSDNDRLRTRHGNAQGRASVPIHSIRQLRATSMDGERPNAGPSNSGHGLKCSGRWAPNSSCCAHPQDDIVSYDYRSRRVPSTSPCGDGVPPSSFAEAFTLVYGVDAPPSALPQDMSKTKNSSTLAAADINAPVTCLSRALHRSRSSSPSRTFRPLLAMAPQAPSASESSATLHTSLDPSSEQAPIAGKEIAGFLPPSSSSTSNHPLFDGTSATAAAAAAGTSGLDLPICHRLRAVPNAILKFTWGSWTQSMARATSSDPTRLAAGFDLGSFPAPLASHEALRGQAAAATGRPTHLGRRSFATATSPADGGGGGGLSDCLAWRPLAPRPLRLGLCSSSRTASLTHEVSGRLPPCRMSAGLPHVRTIGASATASMTRPPRLRPECSFDWGLHLPRWEEVPKEGGPHSTAQFEERMAGMNREAWNPRPFRPVGTPAARLGRWLTAVTANGELSAMTLAAAAGRGPGYVAAKLRANIAVCDPRVSVPPPARAGALMPTDVTMPAAAANRPGAEAGNRTNLAITEPAAAAAAATARATDAVAVEHSAQATEPLPSAPVRLQLQAVEVVSRPASTSLSPPSPPLPQQHLEVEMMEPGDPAPQLHESFPDADATATVVAPQVPSVPSTKLRTTAAGGAGKEGRARPNQDLGRTNQAADEPTWAEKYEETAMPLDCSSRERGPAEPAVGALLATLARLAAEGLTGRGGGGAGAGAGAGAAAPVPGPITPDAGADPGAGSISIPRCRDVQGGEGSREGSSARSRDGSGGDAAADGVAGISCTSARKRRLGEICPEPDPSSIPHPILRRELLLSAIEEQLQLKPLSQAIGVAQD